MFPLHVYFPKVRKPEDVFLSGGGGRGGSQDRRGAEMERCGAVGWSPDGLILTVASTAGAVHGFLARMHIVHASYKAQVFRERVESFKGYFEPCR